MQTTPGDAPADPSTAQPAQPGPSATLFRERLSPGPAYVAGAVGVGVMLGLVVWFVSVGWAVSLGGALAIVLALALWYSSPVVTVSTAGTGGTAGAVFRAGRAWIPLDLLSRPVPLDSDGLRAALGPGSDARAYACQRPWMHSAVRVDVVDPQDPTPSWLVATRDPARLVAALRSAGVSD